MTSASSTSHTATEELVGPFRDSVVLQPDFQKINREYIEIHELMMLQDNSLVGFDDVDLAIPEDDSPVLYRAKITLKYPFAALTSKGRILVEAQLRDMDFERRSRDNLVSGSTVSLNQYRSITLLLQGHKAGLQTSFGIEDDLLLFHTGDQSRKFSVKSLHPLTLANSHIFLGRFRLRALLETAATQPDAPPLHERTPTYFFRALKQRALLPRQRLIYDPKQLATSTSDQRDPAAGSSSSSASQTPRSVSKAEIWHIMAQHAEFILADQGKSRKPFLDLTSWLKFTRLARQQRVLARMNGTTEIDWGTVNGDWDAEVEEDNGMEEEVVESVKTILKGIDVFGVPHTALVRTVQSALQRAQGNLKRQEDELYLPRAVKQEEDTVRHYYASDFSEDSSEASSENESDSESSYDSSIMDELPKSMREVPKLTGFLWNCGIPKCAYSFDIRDTGHQPGTVSAWESFSVTVFNHQSAHLREMGIEAVPRERGEGIRLQRIKKTR